MLHDHVILMLMYSLAVSLFFALLWRRTAAERARFFGIAFSTMFFGGMALAWLMFLLPRR